MVGHSIEFSSLREASLLKLFFHKACTVFSISLDCLGLGGWQVKAHICTLRFGLRTSVCDPCAELRKFWRPSFSHLARFGLGWLGLQSPTSQHFLLSSTLSCATVPWSKKLWASLPLAPCPAWACAAGAQKPNLQHISKALRV